MYRTNEMKKAAAGAHKSSGAIWSSRTQRMRMGLKKTTATALNTIMARINLANGVAFGAFFVGNSSFIEELRGLGAIFKRNFSVVSLT